MPGEHNTEKFKLVGCWVDQDFLAKIDGARGELTRSQFLRDALQDKLETKGISIERHKVIAPDRTGKGGPSIHRAALNEAASSAKQVRDASSKVVYKLRRQRKTAVEL